MLSAAVLSAAGGTAPLVKMAAERLPDLNIPRNGCVMELGPGGEPVVFAGTTSFFRNFKAVTGRTPAQWLAEDSGSCPQ